MTQWIFIIGFGLALLLVAQRAGRRIRTSTDYFLAGRQLGPALIGLSQVANAGLLWALLAVVGSAYAEGAAAIWPATAVLFGYALAWFYLAPRLQALSVAQHSITVGQIFAANLDRRKYRMVLGSLTFIVSISILLLTTARWQLAIDRLSQSFNWTPLSLLLSCAAVLAVFLMMGGYRAASMLEAACAAATALLLGVLMVFALAQASSGPALRDVLQTAPAAWFSGHAGVVALAFVMGTVAAGMADCGQPQAISRFMACDKETLQTARWFALAFLVYLLIAALFIGWCARPLRIAPGEQALAVWAIANRLLPEIPSTVFCVATALYLIFGMGSAWLNMVSGWMVDLRRPRAASPTPLDVTRLLVLVIALGVVLLLWYVPPADSALQRIQLGWQLLGTSLGPWLLVRLSGKRIRAGSTLGALWTGFILTLIFHLMPNAPGDFLERVLPAVAALGIALSGGEQRSDAERADRTEAKTHAAG